MLIFSSLTKINIFLYRPAVFRLSTIQWAGGNSNALNSKNEAQSNRKKLPLPVLIMYTKVWLYEKVHFLCFIAKLQGLLLKNLNHGYRIFGLVHLDCANT